MLIVDKYHKTNVPKNVPKSFLPLKPNPVQTCTVAFWVPRRRSLGNFYANGSMLIRIDPKFVSQNICCCFLTWLVSAVFCAASGHLQSNRCLLSAFSHHTQASSSPPGRIPRKSAPKISRHCSAGVSTPTPTAHRHPTKPRPDGLLLLTCTYGLRLLDIDTLTDADCRLANW